MPPLTPSSPLTNYFRISYDNPHNFPTEKQFIILAMRAMSAITLQTDIAHKHFSHFRPGIAELIFQLGKVRVNKNKQKNKVVDR